MAPEEVAAPGIVSFVHASDDTLGYRPGLDGLRALAIGVVLVAHVGGPSDGVNGWPGVTLFFVLSGYLITRLLLEERSATGRLHVLSFWRRRFARLLPAALLVIVVVALFDPNYKRAWLVAAYLANWTMILHWTPLGPLSHFWSLAVEEQFYLVWPLALTLILMVPMLARPRLLIVIAVGVALLRMAQDDPRFALYATPTRFDALLIGAAAAMVTLPKPRTLLAIAAAVVVAGMSLLPYGLIPSLGIPVVIAASLVLIAFGLTWTPNWALVRIGVISYGLYLWHFPILWTIDAPLGLVLSFMAAELSYRLLEAPLRKLLSGTRPRRTAAAPLPDAYGAAL
jgi:peptidoglycan/LPS O-acetylase OafA/YrhL